MLLSNRSLGLLAVVTALLVVAAVLLELDIPTHTAGATMAPPPPTILPTVEREGGRALSTHGPVRVRATGVEHATVRCGGSYRDQRAFERGRTAFPNIPSGDCTLELDGAEVAWSPVLPGDDLRCHLEDDLTLCTGGAAHRHAARVDIETDGPAEVWIDGRKIGEAPLTDHALPFGVRELLVDFEAPGPVATWSLSLKPEERVRVHFDAPQPTGLLRPSTPVEVD